jgi:hypothetical protein
MKSLIRATGLAIVALALCVAGAASAQENLDSGKSGAQLFASDCTLCHKTPQGLTKAGGLMGLEGFLREHYTASRESAAAVAAYLRATDRGAPAPTPTKRSAKGEKKGDDLLNAAEKKAAPKNAEPKSSASKPTEAKPAETKPAEAKPADAKPAESKPAEAKPVEAKPVEAKPVEAKPADDKPSEPKN